MSTTVKSQKFCKTCDKKVLAERYAPMSTGMGILLTLLTCGLFLPIWLLLELANVIASGFKCPQCGDRV